MNTICEYNNMCNVKISININNVKAVILVGDILKLISFLHHDARSLPRRHGPIKRQAQQSSLSG
jgi:hypothetical protein